MKMKNILVVLLALIMNACAIESLRTENKTPPPVVTEKNPAPTAEPEAKPEPVKVEKKEEPAAHSHSARQKGPIAADEALKLLKSGNQRFQKSQFRKDGALAPDRQRLVLGQKPYAIILSCSDSRVPPEVVFDQKLGEIFVVRTAGQSADFSAIASIEYAVEHLGANLIVVMGHESCGAVKAAHATFTNPPPSSPHLQALIKDIQPRIAIFSSTKISAGALDEGWANVVGAAKDLVEKSQVIREAVQSGEVKIVRSLYHLGTGDVEWQR